MASCCWRRVLGKSNHQHHHHLFLMTNQLSRQKWEQESSSSSVLDDRSIIYAGSSGNKSHQHNHLFLMTNQLCRHNHHHHQFFMTDQLFMQAVVGTSGAGSFSSNRQRKKTSTMIQIVFQKTSTKIQVVSENLNKAAKIFQVVFLFSPTILQRQLDRSGRRSSLVEQNCDRLLRPQIRNWRQIGSKSKFRLETANFKSVLRHLRKMIWCQGLVWWK